MRFAAFTVGTRGDVQPYVALLRGLQARGHTVTLASHPGMQTLVEAHGVPFAPIGPDVDVGRAAAALRGRSRNWILGFVRVMQFTLSVLEKAAPDILALCRDADLVVVSHSFAGAAEAAKLNKPTVSVTLQHQAIPTPEPAPAVFERVARAVAARFMGLLMVRPYNWLRRKIGAPRVKTVEEMMSPHLNLLPISPHVVPRDPRWASQHRLTGYWFLDEPENWRPPADLQTFLEAGAAPVAIALGAMSSGEHADARETVQLILDAVCRVGARAVIQGWEKTLQAFDLPPTIHPAGALPHSWLFKHVTAVVHHGGFGTTAAALRAGVPSVVVPHIIDQLYWGERVDTLGVGPAALRRTRLSADKLAQALQEALHDRELRTRAAELSAQIRAETGVRNAVQLIESTLTHLKKGGGTSDF
ncbi:MAG: glycosyltransferase [Anaerolineae bacterium]